LLDYHIHTHFCGHAVGSMEEYVTRALELGFGEFGFSCHFPYPEGYVFLVPDCVIPQEIFGEYLKEALRLREKYSGRIKIRIGAEFDYLGPDTSFHPLETARYLNLDYCIASVHIVDGIVVDYSPEMLRSSLAGYDGGIDRLYERYYETLLLVAAPGYCTTIGHFDLVKKFNAFPDLAPSKNHSSLADKVLDLLAQGRTVIEINTSGWDKPCREQYPSLDILERAVARGIIITAGSDAHSPEEVGRHFDRLRTILGQLGVRQLARFEKLKALPVDI